MSKVVALVLSLVATTEAVKSLLGPRLSSAVRVLSNRASSGVAHDENHFRACVRRNMEFMRGASSQPDRSSQGSLAARALSQDGTLNARRFLNPTGSLTGSSASHVSQTAMALSRNGSLNARRHFNPVGPVRSMSSRSRRPLDQAIYGRALKGSQDGQMTPEVAFDVRFWGRALRSNAEIIAAAEKAKEALEFAENTAVTVETQMVAPVEEAMKPLDEVAAVEEALAVTVEQALESVEEVAATVEERRKDGLPRTPSRHPRTKFGPAGPKRSLHTARNNPNPMYDDRYLLGESDAEQNDDYGHRWIYSHQGGRMLMPVVDETVAATQETFTNDDVSAEANVYHSNADRWTYSMQGGRMLLPVDQTTAANPVYAAATRKASADEVSVPHFYDAFDNALIKAEMEKYRV